MTFNRLRSAELPNAEMLARAYGPSLRRFFRKRLLTPADADDLVQEVLLGLTRREDLAGVTNLEGYIFQAAANVLRDYLRRGCARQFKDHEPIAEDEIDAAAFSPERVLLGREAVHELKEALLSLPSRTREVFFLGRIEGMPYADIASRLGISLSAVNKHMAKAVEFLMERIKDHF